MYESYDEWYERLGVYVDLISPKALYEEFVKTYEAGYQHGYDDCREEQYEDSQGWDI